MKRFTPDLVLQQVPKSVYYFLIFFLFGVSISTFSGVFFPQFFSEVISWIFAKQEIVVNLGFGGIAANNIVACVVTGVLSLVFSVYFMQRAGKTRELRLHPILGMILESDRKVGILLLLYLFPVGILFTNALVFAFTFTFASLFGVSELIIVLRIFASYAFFEIIAMVLSSSLFFAFIDIIKPYVREGKPDVVRKEATKLLLNYTTLTYLVAIVTLLFFSSIIESVVITNLSLVG